MELQAEALQWLQDGPPIPDSIDAAPALSFPTGFGEALPTSSGTGHFALGDRCRICSEPHKTPDQLASHLREEHELSTATYRAQILNAVQKDGVGPVPCDLLRCRLASFSSACRDELRRAVCALCARRLPERKLIEAFFPNPSDPTPPAWLAWSSDQWDRHRASWFEKLNDLLSVNAYLSTYFKTEERLSAALAEEASASPETLSSAKIWTQRVRAWVEHLTTDITADAVHSPLGSHWLLHPSFTTTTPEGLHCQLCNKCRDGLKTVDAHTQRPRPYLSVVARARGMWGGPEPPELQRLSWMGRRIVQLGRAVICVRHTSGQGASAPGVPYTTGNVLLFPQRAGEVSRALGLLPEDLTCDIALRYPDGDPKAFDADVDLHVSLPVLRCALHWLVTRNWEWLQATRADGDPARNYLGAHLEQLLQRYASSVTTTSPVPQELRQAATAEAHPSTDEAVVVDGGDDSDTPLALWLAALKKYDVLHEAEASLSRLQSQKACPEKLAAEGERLSALRDAIQALQALNSTETRAKLAAFEQARQSHALTFQLPSESDLLDMYSPLLWSHCFSDLFYRGDCWERHPSHGPLPSRKDKGRPLDVSRRWIRTLFQRADFDGWATCKEFAAVAANIFLRRDQLAAIQSWTRADGGAVRLQQTLAELSAEDFVRAMEANSGTDFPTLQAAAARTCRQSGPLHRLFNEMQLVLRQVDGSEAQRCGGVHRMRALRTWLGSSVLFLTVNPADSRSPLTLAYTNSKTGRNVNLPLDVSYETLASFYTAKHAEQPGVFIKIARQNPLAAVQAIRFVLERVLDVLLNCSKASRKPSLHLSADLIASKTEPGIFGHVSGYYAVVETTQNMREHMHALIHILGFHHPEDLFDRPDFHSTFGSIWGYFASVAFASPEGFARYTGSAAAMSAVNHSPVVPVTPKQWQLLGSHLAADVVARQKNVRSAADQSAPPHATQQHASVGAPLPWPHSVQTQTSNHDTWAAISTVLANQAAIAYGNHVCLPATCYKRGKKYCRMLYWHWAACTKAGAPKLRRAHGLPLASHWSGVGQPPLIQEPPHNGLPALERHHPFHYKMTPGILLGPSCNHDLGILFRFPDPTLFTSRADALRAMIDAISTHEYYCAGYLQKGSDPCQGILHALHDAKTKCDRILAAETRAQSTSAGDPAKNARRLFARMIFAMNQRHRLGFQTIYAYLLGKPTYYCSHDFVPLQLHLHLRQAEAAVTTRSAVDCPPCVEATLPDAAVPTDPPPASTAPTYVAYDYPWRPRSLETLSFYFFTASTTVVTTPPETGWLWPTLVDFHGQMATHPCYLRRSTDPRFLCTMSQKYRGTPLTDPFTEEPLRKYDHYRRFHTDTPWRLPQIFGGPTQTPTEGGDALEKGEYALAAMLIFRPWRHTGAAVLAWSSPFLSCIETATSDDLWVALHDAFVAWRAELREAWVIAAHSTTHVHPGTPQWWQCLTYEKLRNYELTKAHIDHQVFKKPRCSADPASSSDSEQDSQAGPCSSKESLAGSCSSNELPEEPLDPSSDARTGDEPLPGPPPAGIPCGNISAGPATHCFFGLATSDTLTGRDKQYFDGVYNILTQHNLSPTSHHISPEIPELPTSSHPSVPTSALKLQQKFFDALDSAATQDAAAPLPPPSKSMFQARVHDLLAKWSLLKRQQTHPNSCVLEAVQWLLDKGAFSASADAKLNLKQARGLILAGLWLQNHVAQSHSRDPEPLPPDFTNILLVTGGAGSGKTTLLLVIEQLFHHFAGDCLHKAAPTITASRLIRGDTIHALHKLPRTTLTSRRGRMTSQRLAAHRQRWRGKIGHCVDEISMTSPKQLHQINVRCQEALQSSKPFGGLWTWLSGDFLQLPPVGMPSLADPTSAGATDGETALGQAVWQGVTTHINLNENMRSSGQLARLLQQMRDGALTDDLWAALCARLIQPTHSGEPDPRLQRPPFTSACQCIVSRHAVRAPIAYAQTLQRSIETRQLFCVLQALDTIVSPPPALDLANAHKHFLAIANIRHTGSLPGILPLHVGAYVRLTGGKNCLQLGIMKGALCQIVDMQLHPHDRQNLAFVGDVHVLQFLPSYLLLRLVGAAWTLPQTCLSHFPPLQSYVGVFLLAPDAEQFNFKYAGHDLKVRRTSFAVLPAQCNVVYAAQGESFQATLLDLAAPPRTDPKKHWLAIYVMLSRAHSLDAILLLRNAPREAFTCGPPEFLSTELRRLHQIENDTTARALKFLLQSSPALRGLASYFAACPAASGTNPSRALEPPLKRCRGKQAPSVIPMHAAPPSTGLLNTDNTCYLNALLFALHASPVVQTWVAAHARTCTHPACPVPLLHADFATLDTCSLPAFLPSIASSRAHWCPQLAGNQHHDVTETFSKLLAAAETCERSRSPLHTGDLNDQLHLPIWRCFGAPKLQTLHCANCNTSSASRHLHTFVHVHPTRPIFQDCRRTSDPLPESRCPTCTADNGRSISLSMESWPSTLIFCINRWAPNPFDQRPPFTETLNPPGCSTQYRIRAAIYHSGTPDQGHYTAITHFHTGPALRDDSLPPHAAPPSHLLQPNLYMLVYDCAP